MLSHISADSVVTFRRSSIKVTGSQRLKHLTKVGKLSRFIYYCMWELYAKVSLQSFLSVLFKGAKVLVFFSETNWLLGNNDSKKLPNCKFKFSLE